MTPSSASEQSKSTRSPTHWCSAAEPDQGGHLHEVFVADESLLAEVCKTKSGIIISNHHQGIRIRSNDTLQWFHYDQSGGYQFNLNTNMLLRDPSAWYHIVGVLDSTQGTSANRAKLYVNGVEITAKDTDYGTPPRWYQSNLNSTISHKVGYNTDGHSFKVWSDSDLSGITVNANQDGNWKSKNPYYFYLTDSEESNGDTLYAQVGDALYVEYVDTTLPRVGPNGELNSKSDTLDIIATTSVISRLYFLAKSRSLWS